MDKKKFITNGIVVCLLSSFCCMLWGSASPAIKVGYRLFNISSNDTPTRILFAGYRFTLAGILVIIIGSILNRKIMVPKKEMIPKIMTVGLFQTIIQYFCFYIGLANTTGVKATIISSGNAFISLLLASLLFNLEKLTLKKLIGCVFGLAGVIIINLKGLDFSITFMGEGMILASVVAFAFSTILAKIYSKNEDPVMISGYQFIFGGIILTLISSALGGNLGKVGFSGIGILTYLSFLSAIAYSLWGILLKHNPVSKVAIYAFMTPVFGVLLSTIFLPEEKEAFGINAIIAVILVSIGIIISNIDLSKKPVVESKNSGLEDLDRL
ncbi:DMT family transporter [Fusobacterium sp. PH5-44]|uniref:DMT family transporter n=1 Tax=unclassified Fusobacterium TaxID=2648384 RepID=UPI003D1D5ABC